ncbi:MAG: response regulator transcription factor [Chloroflexi bacterium]|nr:response regulator transcription factor [Chloroflexota bacterium]
MTVAPLKVLIVDDHEVVRVGLRSLLDRKDAFTVVAEAESVAGAVQAAARHAPDVVIMDVRLPDGSGVEACREIRSHNPQIKVVMLTSYADDDAIFASIMAGASGFLLKQIHSRALVEALQVIGQGGSLLDPTVTQKVLERMRRLGEGEAESRLAGLSDQERRILSLVAEGKTNKEISQVLSLSDKTVKNHVSNILGKLHMARRTEAAAYYVRSEGQKEE